MDTKEKGYKRIMIKKIFVLSLFWLVLWINPLHANQDIVVNNHHIDILVKENGQYDFKHTLNVTFSSPYYGIFVNIPQAYQMNWDIDGESFVREYLFPLTDISIDATPGIIERYRQGVTLKLGEEGVYVNGPQIYVYSYTMNTRDLRLDGRQRFYLNFIGSEWEIPTEKVSFNVQFEQSIIGLTPSFYAGAFNTNTAVFPQLTITANSISGTFDEYLNPFEAFTIDMNVPTTFFKFTPRVDYTFISILLSLALFILLVLVYQKHGKDDPVTEVVGWTPPKGLSSAMVGYVFDGFVDNKDVLSLIIYWASKGYMTIEEIDKNTVKFTKLRELDEGIKAEKIMFDEMFRNREHVTTAQLKYKFYDSIVAARSNILAHFKHNPDMKVYSSKSIFYQYLFAFLLSLPLAINVFISVFQTTLSFEAIIFSIMLFIGSFILHIISVAMARRSPSYKTARKIGRNLFFVIGSFIITMISLLVVSMHEGLIIYVVMNGVLFFLGLWLNNKMDKRTTQGNAWLGEILGFKHFIEVAEKARLEMLVRENPSYFYHILPYAYVLNVSDVWSKQFESIAIDAPSWYIGPSYTNSYVMMRSLNRTLGTMNQTMTVPAPSKGKGGGGFGGGGFSGGGFGGGGGGGWK
jgi:uncharacterized membrane protein YgcG